MARGRTGADSSKSRVLAQTSSISNDVIFFTVLECFCIQ